MRDCTEDIVVIPVGSGSTGNCFYLEIGPYAFLIDMGIGYRKVKAALELHERRLEDVDAVFLTHGHHDHIKASLPLGNHLSCPVYGHKMTATRVTLKDKKCAVLKTDQAQEIFPGLEVRMFAVPHDYPGTCGYSFTYNDRKVSYCTDCGEMDPLLLEELKGSDVVIIESNHDVEMLKKGPYPYFLQERILSRYGHLSNDDCAKTVEKLYESGTRNYLLAHLSLQNNTPDTALETVRNVMKEKEIFLYACPAEGNDLLRF